MTQHLISLTKDEYESLILALGYATGAAMKTGETNMQRAFLKLANAINRDNSSWVPYEIPPEDADGSEAPHNPQAQSH